MIQQEVDLVTGTGRGEYKLNTRPKKNPAFAVEHLMLGIGFTLTNQNAATQDFTNEVDWDAVIIKFLKSDGKAIVNSISAKSLESMVQMVKTGATFAPVVFNTVTVPAKVLLVPGTLEVSAIIRIPLRLMLLERPRDTDLCFDLLGDISVSLPAPASADLSISNVNITVIADGHLDHNGHVKLGPTLCYEERTATADKADTIGLSGDKLVGLQLITRDHTGNSLNGYAGPTIKIDSQLPLIDLPNQNVVVVNMAYGDLGTDAEVERPSMTAGEAVILFRPRLNTKLSELPEGSAINIAYRTAASVTKGKVLYGVVSLAEPPVQAALGAIPQFQDAWTKHGPANLEKAGVSIRPTADGVHAKDAPPAMKRWLPVELRLEGIAK